MAEQTEEEYENIHLAQTIFSNIELFEVTFRAKKKDKGENPSWKTIAGKTKLKKKPEEQWRDIMTKFVSGNLKEENETLFEEVKKILRCFPIVQNALDGAENKDNQQSPSAAEGKSPTPHLDEQNKKKRQEKIKELTEFSKKLKHEISAMEERLLKLTEQLANKLDELKKIE